MLNETLVLNYLKIPHIVYNEKFRMYAHLKEDLISEGWLGLCVASTKYNNDIKESFTNYAFKYVKGYMYHYVKKYKVFERSCEDVLLLEETKNKPIEQQYQEQKIDEYIKQLPKKDRFILQELFWNTNKKNIIAKEINYTPKGLKFKRKTILNKLKKLMDGKKLTILERYDESYKSLADKLNIPYGAFVWRRKNYGEDKLISVIELKNKINKIKEIIKSE